MLDPNDKIEEAPELDAEDDAILDNIWDNLDNLPDEEDEE